MIIEFCGLPGAGKSTLEAAVLAELERRNRLVINREVLVQELIGAQNSVQRDAGAVRRRISTGMYKAHLYKHALEVSGLSVLESRHSHVRRAAMRVAESVALQTNFDHGRGIANLSEGLAQHSLSLHVWRSLYGCANDRIQQETQPDENVVVVSLDLPAATAISRLEARGRPSFWPTQFSTEAIIEQYFEIKTQNDSTAASATTYVVDATVAESEWPGIAAAVVEFVESRLPAERNE